MYHHIGLPFSQNLDPLPSLFLLRPSPFTKFAFSLAISFSVLSRSKLDTQKWIFSRFFKVQIRLDSFVQKLWIIVWESSSFCFVVVVGSTSLVVLDVVALLFSANAAAACVLVCLWVGNVCLSMALDCVCVPLCPDFIFFSFLIVTIVIVVVNVFVFSLCICVGIDQKTKQKQWKKKAQSESVCVL